MMDCQKSRSFVNAWENGETTLTGLEEFQTHFKGCRECSRRFGAIMPLILREGARSGGPGAAALPAGFADDIIAAISMKKKRRVAYRPALMAAAAAIFAVGLGLGATFTFLKSDIVTVKFVLEAPEAQTVYLVGDFNSWSAEDYRLRRSESTGSWEISVPLKKGLIYVYNFVLDGKEWIADPKVPTRINDDFGGSGSLLRL